ncbi:MAG: hypothetical protein JRE40_13770 [Deltaproteobacteria bacterium]|nr:hypothetical protein [Deltaproteobacteria bacterium]
MKIWAYLAIFILVIGAAGAAAKSIHSAGYNKRDQEVQQDIIDAQETARVDEEAKWRATVAAAEATIIIEERIVEKIRVVEKEIPRIVERIVELTPECADLGPDYAGLLNDQIRASNSVSSPEAPTGVVEGMP